MASIERPAYPRLKPSFRKSELSDFYTPTLEELHFVREKSRKSETQLHLLIHLKVFQRLGYFPNIEDVYEGLIKYLQSVLKFPADVLPLVARNTLYQQQSAILQYLNVKSYDRAARRLVTKTVYGAAQVMDNPADLINVAIEELIKERYELPAFSTLDRIVGKIRSLVNRRIFQTILRRLSPAQILTLDRLLLPDEKAYRTPYNSLKQLPKKATLKHLQELLNHLEWLMGLGDFGEVLANVPAVKIKHFYAEAKALDAREIKDFAEPKRYALLTCTVHRASIKARDALAEMFIKRMAKLHQKGKEELDKKKLRQMEKTERLVTMLTGVLQNVDLEKSDAEVGKSVKRYFAHQDIKVLLGECVTVSAYYGDNYFPLVWKFYRSHRSTLFRLVAALKLSSTSSDRSLIESLDFLVENESKRGDYLEAAADLTFATEKWQRTVLKTVDGI